MLKTRAGYVVALILAVLCWSTVPVFISYLNIYLGNFTQNLYRYIPACILLWTLTLVLFRSHLSLGRRLLVLLAPMGIICVHQLLWVQSIKLTTPTTTSLLTQFQVVIVGLLAWIFFHEERSTIISKRFLIGAVLALAGVAGFILFAVKAEFKGGTAGCLVVLLTAAVWAVYTVVAKVAIRGLHPVASFTWVCTGVLVFFVVTTPVFGQPRAVLEVPLGVQIALVASGMIGIALAHIFFYIALSRLSAAVCGAAILASPVPTGAWSFICFHETLTPLQFLFGAVLLLGAGLTISQPGPVEGPPD